MRLRTIVVAAVLALVVSVVAAAPGLASRPTRLGPPARPADHGWAPPVRPAQGTDGAGPAAGGVRTFGAPVGAAERAGGREAGGRLATASGMDEAFVDVCDDAAPGGIDIRRSHIVTFDSPREILFTVETCRRSTAPDLASGVLWYLFGRSSDTPDYVVSLLPDGSSGFRIEVEHLELSSGEPVWTKTYEAADARWIEEGWEIGGRVPVSAIGDLPEFFWFAESGDDTGQVVDELPDADRPLLAWPDGSCEGELFAVRREVRAAPGHLATALAAAREAGLVPTSVVPSLGVFEVVLADASDTAALARLPGVASVDRPAVLHRAGTVTPDESRYDEQWALAVIGAESAYSVTDGAGVTIGIVDDGIDATRPDLSGRVAAGVDAVTGEPIPAGVNSDMGGHGTSVAAVAAATTGNGAEIAGVAPGAVLRPYRVQDASTCISSTAIAAAVDAAVRDGVDVINLSLGGEDRETMTAAVERAAAAGIVVVAAAGNEGSADGETYPAAYPSVIAVGATDRQDRLATYSNRASWVELVAPGGDGSGDPATDVLTLGERDTLVARSGTSFSTPMVAGAAALYLASHPGATAGETRAALAGSAVDLGPTGRDPGFGHGRLDLTALFAHLALPPAQARTIALACPEHVPARGFPDVVGVHGPAVDCVVWWQVAGGYPDGTYRPAAGVTRGQMATFVARAIDASPAGLPPAGDRFADDDGNPHEPAIDRLSAAGVVGGFADGTFRPHATVTRAQMATFLAAAYEYVDGRALEAAPEHFRDDDGSPHEPRIDQVAELGLTGGAGPASYAPADHVTRGQMATFLARLLDLFVEQGRAAPPQ